MKNRFILLLGLVLVFAVAGGACAAPPTIPATQIAATPVAQSPATQVAPPATNTPTATATHTAVPPTPTNTSTPTLTPSPTRTSTPTKTATSTATSTPLPTNMPPPTATFTRVPATIAPKPTTAPAAYPVPPDQAGFLIQNLSGMPITVNLSSAIGGNPEEISLEPGAERFLTTPSRLIVWAVQFPGSDFVPGGLALMQTGQLKTLKIYKQPGGDCYQPECYEYIPPNS